MCYAPIAYNVPLRSVQYEAHESIWQRNYYERIIRSNAEYARVVKYINDNPAKWKGDIFNKRLNQNSQNFQNLQNCGWQFCKAFCIVRRGLGVV